MSSVSCAMRFCFASGSDAIVRMLCSRSASLMSRTRTSFAIATSILRIVAACCASLESNCEPVELGDAVDDRGDVGAELGDEVVERDRRVLDRVVQQRGRERHVVEPEVGEDHRDAERVRDVRVARPAHLVLVRVAGDVVRVLDQRRVGARVRARGTRRAAAAAPSRPAPCAGAAGRPSRIQTMCHTMWSTPSSYA